MIWGSPAFRRSSGTRPWRDSRPRPSCGPGARRAVDVGATAISAADPAQRRRRGAVRPWPLVDPRTGPSGSDHPAGLPPRTAEMMAPAAASQGIAQGAGKVATMTILHCSGWWGNTAGPPTVSWLRPTWSRSCAACCVHGRRACRPRQERCGGPPGSSTVALSLVGAAAGSATPQRMSVRSPPPPARSPSDSAGCNRRADPDPPVLSAYEMSRALIRPFPDRPGAVS